MVNTLRFVRAFFLFLSVFCGYYVGTLFMASIGYGPWIGIFAGLMFAILIIFLEIKLREVSLRNLSAAVFGLVFGFFIAWMLTLILRLIPMDAIFYSIFQIIFTLLFCYLGMTISIKGKDEFNLIIPYVRFSREDQRDQLYLLDTSVIIDGRIVGICEAGFLEGKLVVPRFVLAELQQIADSADDAKRVRGRRGLDILNILKKMEKTEVIVHDEILPQIKEVDAKLVHLAKILNCKVITNDFNLNKVAKLESVTVLNINDLANALRMVVYPGEEIRVYIRKEGKEKNQGVAFMDDGTMIVVDNARRYIGKHVNVAVSSVLQTSAGRMVFGALIEKQSDIRSEREEGAERRDFRQHRGGERPRDEGHRGENRGQRSDDRGHRSEDRGQRSEDRGHRSDDRGHRQEDRGHRSDDRGHRPDDRSQRTEDREQRPEDRGQRTEDREQKPDDKGQKAEGTNEGQGVDGGTQTA